MGEKGSAEARLVPRTAIRTAILPYCLLVILLQDLTLCRLNRDRLLWNDLKCFIT